MLSKAGLGFFNFYKQDTPDGNCSSGCFSVIFNQQQKRSKTNHLKEYIVNQLSSFLEPSHIFNRCTKEEITTQGKPPLLQVKEREHRVDFGDTHKGAVSS